MLLVPGVSRSCRMPGQRLIELGGVGGEHLGLLGVFGPAAGEAVGLEFLRRFRAVKSDLPWTA